MKEQIQNVIKFMEDYVIECNPDDGCGRCNEARRHVKALKGIDIATEVERRIKERLPSGDDGRDHIPYPDKPTELKHYQNIGFIRGWRAAIKEVRSRLTENKQEGGGK